MKRAAARPPRRQKLPLAFEPPAPAVIEETIRQLIEQWGTAPSYGAIARALGIDDETLRWPFVELLEGKRVVLDGDGYNLSCRLNTYDAVIRRFTADVVSSGEPFPPDEVDELLRGLKAVRPRRRTEGVN